MNKNLIVVQNAYEDITHTAQSILSIREAAHRWGVNFYEITHKQFDKCFKLSCCSTIHRVQCKTIKSYYWCIEDNKDLTPDICYVVVSRM